MGQRANLVVVTETGYELYYCHWCANKIETMLFWGPEHALKAIRAQDAVDVWLDNVWAEGGVLMDIANHVLIFFCGQDLRWEFPMRRIFLSLMSYLWEGWEIRWAYKGILDMADYVGVKEQHGQTSPVTAPQKTPIEELFVDPEDVDKKYVEIVGSVLTEDHRLCIFFLNGKVKLALEYGAGLAKLLQNQSPLSDFDFAPKCIEYNRFEPTGGFHLDLSQKHLYFWNSNDDATSYDIQPFWEGWDVITLGDGFEAHSRLTENRLKFWFPSVTGLLLQITQLLTRQAENSADRFKAFLNQLEQLGGQAIVNPEALVDVQSELDLDTKHVLIEYALQCWFADHPQDKQNGEQ